MNVHCVVRRAACVAVRPVWCVDKRCRDCVFYTRDPEYIDHNTGNCMFYVCTPGESFVSDNGLLRVGGDGPGCQMHKAAAVLYSEG